MHERSARVDQEIDREALLSTLKSDVNLSIFTIMVNNQDVYCLYHLKKSCVCSSPITEINALRARLEAALELLYKVESGGASLINIKERIEEFERRLGYLKPNQPIESADSATKLNE